jgi:hypothetical protein
LHVCVWITHRPIGAGYTLSKKVRGRHAAHYSPEDFPDRDLQLCASILSVLIVYGTTYIMTVTHRLSLN